ncbi:MAG: hypothetical protein OXH83_02355, partial [Bryobacterales bacterium]|nr:hypothetical protein [Bryobacterales bacterium]
MADIALDARDAQRNVAGNTSERRRNRVSLDPVTDDSAGRMSLDILRNSIAEEVQLSRNPAVP